MKKTVFCVVFIALALCAFGQTGILHMRQTSEGGMLEINFDLEYKRENGGIIITRCVSGAKIHQPVAIPEKIDGLPVTAIGNHAFQDKFITGVTIPNTVTTIGMYAFDNNRLKSVIIPDSVITIGKGAFFQNPLTSVTIGNSVTTIGDEAFSGDRIGGTGDRPYKVDLTGSVTIPDSVITIGDEAFNSNFNLTSVTIPRSVKTIGAKAFQYTRLTSVTIPRSVTTISDDAFDSDVQITRE